MNNEENFNNNNNSDVDFYVLFYVLVLILIALSLVFGSIVKRNDASMPSEAASRDFVAPNLQAKAAYVYDLRSKTVIYAKNENTRMPLASLTKVMSALVAKELSDQYQKNNITVSQSALATEGDSGLVQNERWSIDKLLDFSLITSSNDGIRAAALALGSLLTKDTNTEDIDNEFVREMNKKASELDLHNTYFWNETGLDINASDTAKTYIKGGAYGTAKDMSTLMEYILTYHPELFYATKDSSEIVKSLDNKNHVAKNTNVIVSEIPGLMASKTGFTDVAGGNLIVAFDPELGRPIIISVLGSTEDGRFLDMENLINATMSYISK